jgi:hypothetical protein
MAQRYVVGLRLWPGWGEMEVWREEEAETPEEAVRQVLRRVGVARCCEAVVYWGGGWMRWFVEGLAVESGDAER